MEISKEQLALLAESVGIIANGGNKANTAVTEIGRKLNEAGVWAEFGDFFIVFLQASATQMEALKTILVILQQLQVGTPGNDDPTPRLH